jgi:uncharacterized protein YndB with AHSA1/START domain
MAKQVDDTALREIAVNRLLDAPQTLVFDVWTRPEHVINWWGPQGFTNTIQEMDVRAGGTWRFIMHGPEGYDYDNRITFIEVIKPWLLVYMHGADMENDPEQFQVTVTFEDINNKTLLTMRCLFNTIDEYDEVIGTYGAVQGSNQTLDKLETYLSNLKATNCY